MEKNKNTITVNGIQINGWDYDDEKSIINKYVIALSKKKDDFFLALPSFFKMSKKSKPKNIILEDIREILLVSDSEKLLDGSFLQKLMYDYPNLDKKEIGILWYLTHSKNKAIKSQEKEDLHDFDRRLNYENESSEYLNQIKEDLKKIERQVEKGDEIYQSLKKIKKVEAGQIIKDEVKTSLLLDLPGGEKIIDVFDCMVVSEYIPYIHMRYKNKNYYKIYEKIEPVDPLVKSPLEEWITRDSDDEKEDKFHYDGIYFKILDIDKYIPDGRILLKNMYSDCEWTTDNIVSIRHKLKGNITAEIMKSRFEMSLSGLKYKILDMIESGIRFHFELDCKWNPFLFSDFVFTNDIVKYFGFINESTKPILDKKVYRIHYNPGNHGVIPGSNLIALNDYEMEKTRIKVTHSKNIHQAESIRTVMGYLFGLYEQNVKNAIAKYKKIYLLSDEDIGILSSEKKENLKTQQKLKKLQDFGEENDMDIFKYNYSVQCQKNFQPNIFKDKKQAESFKQKYLDTLKAELSEDNYYLKHVEEKGVVEWSPSDEYPKAYYVCGGDDVTKPKIFGTKKNTSKNIEYSSKYPCIPCCYDKETKCEDTEKVQKSLYIVKSSKMLSDKNKWGVLPYNFQKLFFNDKIDNVELKGEITFPYLRFSVEKSPMSLLFCLEKVKNKYYLSQVKDKELLLKNINEKKRKMIEIINSGNGVYKQETYDYSKDKLIDILDPNKAEYIDIDIFFSLIRYTYQLNIFVIDITEKKPEGEILIPRACKAYFHSKFNEEWDTVILIRHQSGTVHQYEIVSDISMKNASNFNKDHILTKKIRDVFYKANKVYVVSDNKVKSI